MQVSRERSLGLDEALEIARRLGYEVKAKPVIVHVWSTRYHGRGVTLYLPGYILNVEIDRNGKEKVEVESACDCSCSCPEHGDELLW